MARSERHGELAGALQFEPSRCGRRALEVRAIGLRDTPVTASAHRVATSMVWDLDAAASLGHVPRLRDLGAPPNPGLRGVAAALAIASRVLRVCTVTLPQLGSSIARARGVPL